MEVPLRVVSVVPHPNCRQIINTQWPVTSDKSYWYLGTGY